MKKIILSLAITAIIFSFSVTAKAQDFTFVVFETTVTSEDITTNDENPTERRFYISNVVEVPRNIRSYQTRKIADDYFTENVVEKMKANGINHQFYDNNIQMDCGSVLAAKDKADAEEKLAKCIEDTKGQARVTVYTFNWTFGKANGLETTQPKLIYRDKDSPNYQPKGETTPKVETVVKSSTVIKPTKQAKKSKKNQI